MKEDTFANRLKRIMSIKGVKQVELSKKTGLDKSLISCYLSGKYEAKQNNLTILANALGVNEAWLMGYDLDTETVTASYEIDDELIDKIRSLSSEDKEMFLKMVDSIIERDKK